MPVLMGLADEEGFPHSGTINFVDNRLDVATGTFKCAAFSTTRRIFSRQVCSSAYDCQSAIRIRRS